DVRYRAQAALRCFFQAEDGIRDRNVTGVQTCALPISAQRPSADPAAERPRRLHLPSIQPRPDAQRRTEHRTARVTGPEEDRSAVEGRSRRTPRTRRPPATSTA